MCVCVNVSVCLRHCALREWIKMESGHTQYVQSRVEPLRNCSTCRGVPLWEGSSPCRVPAGEALRTHRAEGWGALMDHSPFLNLLLRFEVLFFPEAPSCSYPDGGVCVVTRSTPVNGAFFLTHFWASLDRGDGSLWMFT